MRMHLGVLTESNGGLNKEVGWGTTRVRLNSVEATTRLNSVELHPIVAFRMWGKKKGVNQSSFSR